MSNTMRQLLDNIESNNVINILKDSRERQAASLRIKFFKEYIIKKNTNAYKTKVERDYSYTALREYRYNVQLYSVVSTLALASSIFIIQGLYYKKTKFGCLIFTPAYFGFHKYSMIKYNKRLFDMCNVGEETELGYQRNLYLKECNKILNREDF